MKLILASSSIFRKQLLLKLGVPFECISPDIDESRLDGETVTKYVKRLSIEKAKKIATNYKNSIKIGRASCRERV